MARNEDGEFELILGNKQLLSVFFLMVLLLGLCFVGGYVLGRSAAPVLNATNEPPPQLPSQESKALVVIPTTPNGEPVQAAPPAPSSTPAPESVPASSAPPTKTAPQVAADAPPVEAKAPPPPPKAPPTKAAPKAAPPAAKTAPPATKAAPVPAKQIAKQAPATSQPVPGRIYLQLSATDKDKADVMVDLLRRKNLPGTAAAIADKPGLYRALVGPLAENALSDMKAQLKANGFPGDQAIRRVF